MSILAWIIAGLAVGWLASLIKKGTGYGVVGDIIVGIVGALVAGCFMSVLLGYSIVSGLDLESVLFALLGAVILITILRVITFPERV